MSTRDIFFTGVVVSAICLAGLLLSNAEMKRLGSGGGERSLSMAIGPERDVDR